jgi:hypothetical protein
MHGVPKVQNMVARRTEDMRAVFIEIQALVLDAQSTADAIVWM